MTMTLEICKVCFFLTKNKKAVLLLFAFFISFHIILAQEQGIEKVKPKNFRVMFYNVENFFDPFDDTLTNDNEFLPKGIRNWNYSRFVKKRNNIYKTIMAVGGWEPPAIIGLCEIENRFVLKQLIYETPFAQFDYRIVQEESPDKRGIDVALLFNPKVLRVIYHKAIAINFKNEPESKTRDILYVKGLVNNNDTLHIFVNHWPSKYGGELSSEPRRVFVAQQLAMQIDSLFELNKEASIIVMGDFNDSPSTHSVKDILNSGKNKDNNRLINIMPINNHDLGSYKFNGEWEIIDQIMVSNALLLQDKGIFVPEEAHIFSADFLLEEDAKFLGKMPFRTYKGMKYSGGFSDHLPVFVDLKLK